jgi:hypothetical protein
VLLMDGPRNLPPDAPLAPASALARLAQGWILKVEAQVRQETYAETRRLVRRRAQAAAAAWASEDDRSGPGRSAELSQII